MHCCDGQTLSLQLLCWSHDIYRENEWTIGHVVIWLKCPCLTHRIITFVQFYSLHNVRLDKINRTDKNIGYIQSNEFNFNTHLQCIVICVSTVGHIKKKIIDNEMIQFKWPLHLLCVYYFIVAVRTTLVLGMLLSHCSIAVHTFLPQSMLPLTFSHLQLVMCNQDCLRSMLFARCFCSIIPDSVPHFTVAKCHCTDPVNVFNFFIAVLSAFIYALSS